MGDKTEQRYIQMIKLLDSLLMSETNTLANLANASALLKQTLDKINGVEFYLYEAPSDELILGPFQGKVVCTHILMNPGIYDPSAYQRKILCIDNVRDFNGHISCDSASNSKSVTPIMINNTLCAY